MGSDPLTDFKIFYGSTNSSYRAGAFALRRRSRAYQTRRGFSVVADPQASNQSTPSLTRSNLS